VSKYIFRSALFIGLACFFSACQLLNDATSSQLQNAPYRLANTRVNVEVINDTLVWRPVQDTAGVQLAPPKSLLLPHNSTLRFTRILPELGIITVPVKYRPALRGFAPQLNPTINANLFVGLRRQVHTFRYRQLPISGQYVRSETQGAISFGGFTGISQDYITPFNTAPAIGIEYDGVVWQNGLTLHLDYNHLSAGLAVGIDHLADPNRSAWIYERRPWVGAVFGFNFN
jgi:hypothetical protein